MKAAISSLEPGPSELRGRAAFTLVSEPLLRYSDPTRGDDIRPNAATNVLLDAGVWRLGTEGRPTALVTLEIYQSRDASRFLSFEFLSLSETPFSLRHKSEKVRWDASGSALDWNELADAPRPAPTAAARLVQLRQLARRFAAKEHHMSTWLECRLLTQPIDRYQSPAQKIVDGAIFAYANGTNPELGVVLETDGERWRYGVVRLTGAEAVVTLDGRQVAAFEQFSPRGRTDGPYQWGRHPLPAGK
jgi:hypothetical protein